MRADIAECTVVEVKFREATRDYLIVAELKPIGHIHMLCPFEHKLKVGDKVKLFVDIPLVVEQVDPVKLFGA